MTKRGLSLVFALALVLALGVGTAAQAAPRLTVKQAKRVAVKLGRKQVRKYDLRAYHLGKAHRVSRTRIVFPYDARTQANTYCTAKMRVRKHVRGNRILITAAIGRQDCATMPDDALAVERATRRGERRMRPRVTRRALRRVTRSLARCHNVRVPKRRRAAVRAIADVATTNALVRPNNRALDRFVADLFNVDTSRRVLGDGIAAWGDYLDVVQNLPSFRHPCATIKRWRSAGWSADASPIDMAEYRQSRRFATGDKRAIARAARFLARVGVFPRLVVAFTPQGLLLHLAPTAQG
jgi:hypothetical protein